MAKIKYDVKGVESTTVDYDTPIPVGLYMAQVKEVEELESKAGNPMLKITLEVITKGEHKGRRLWEYIVLNDASAWKLKQFVDALGLKDSGTLDTNKVIGDKMQVRVKHETDQQYGTQARVGSMLPLPDDLELDEDDDSFEEAEPEADGDELVWEDLLEYDREDLEELIEEEELEIKFNKRTNDEVLRQRVAEALGIAEADEDEDEPEADDEDEDAELDDYADWAVDELREELKRRELKHTGPKSALVKRLQSDDTESDDEPF